MFTFYGRDWHAEFGGRGPPRYFWPVNPRGFKVWGNAVVRVVFVLDATTVPIERVFHAVMENVWNRSSDSCVGYVRWFRWGARGLVFMYLGRWTTMVESEGSFTRHIERWAYYARRCMREDDPPGSSNDVDMMLAAYDPRVIRVGTCYINDKYLNLRYWHFGVVAPEVLRTIVPVSFAHVPELPRLDPLHSVIGPILARLLRRDYQVPQRIAYEPIKV